MTVLTVAMRAAGPIPLDLSLRVEAGSLLALVGPSGSGKTTVLRTIAGLWRPAFARVAVGAEVWQDSAAGLCLPPHRRRVGMVFQSYALFPHMTAAANVVAAMTVPDRAGALRLLDLVNLSGLADRRPAELSGGQQQRVALARALARQPQVLLLDEPFAAVDRPTRDRLHAEIAALRAHLAMPVILVTHDMAEAQALADRVAVIERGHLLREGPLAEVMADPEALRALGLREVAGWLHATVAEHLPDGLVRLRAATGDLFLPGVEAAPGSSLRLRISAHDVILSRAAPAGLSAQNILPARIARIVAGQGPGVIVHLAIGDDEIPARITRRAADQLLLRPGDSVHAVMKAMAVARGHIAPLPVAPG